MGLRTVVAVREPQDRSESATSQSTGTLIGTPFGLDGSLCPSDDSG